MSSRERNNLCIEAGQLRTWIENEKKEGRCEHVHLLTARKVPHLSLADLRSHVAQLRNIKKSCEETMLQASKNTETPPSPRDSGWRDLMRYIQRLTDEEMRKPEKPRWFVRPGYYKARA